MKVLFLYKFLTLGGVEAVLRARLDGLSRSGIEAHAWFLYDLGGRSIFTGREGRVHVGTVEECLRFARDRGFALLDSIDTEEILPALAAEPGPPRLVFECHSAYLENIEYLRELAAFRPAAVLTPSQSHRQTVRERVGEEVEVRVIPNPLRQEFVDEPAPFPAPPERPVAAWIGRLDTLKNWEAFVEILADLGRRGTDVEGWIVGKPVGNEGPEKLLERARGERVLERLRWFGALPYGRIPLILDAVRDSGGVVVSTSRAESFGLTIAEAMARRCAVVVPDQPPFTEFVEEGVTGSLFTPGSATSAAGRIEEMLAGADRRAACGGRAREAILARFAPGPALDVLAWELWRLSTS